MLLYEMDLLASLGPHKHLVSLLRVCTVEREQHTAYAFPCSHLSSSHSTPPTDPIYIITDYMCHGDLLGFLRASRGHYSMYTVSPGFRNQQPPTLQLSSRDLISIGAKVASGMHFLADRKVRQSRVTAHVPKFLLTVSTIIVSYSHSPLSLSADCSSCFMLQKCSSRFWSRH